MLAKNPRPPTPRRTSRNLRLVGRSGAVCMGLFAERPHVGHQRIDLVRLELVLVRVHALGLARARHAVEDGGLHLRVRHLLLPGRAGHVRDAQLLARLGARLSVHAVAAGALRLPRLDGLRVRLGGCAPRDSDDAQRRRDCGGKPRRMAHLLLLRFPADNPPGCCRTFVSAAHDQRTTRTGLGLICTSRSATLPSNARATALRPRWPTTTSSTSPAVARSASAKAGEPSAMIVSI